MQFESLQTFFSMGGYGFYVWLSFGVTLLSMAILVIQSFVERKQLLSQVLKEQSRRQRIKQARQAKPANSIQYSDS
ncbi:heme exporter protein CcmD [Alteromonas ponticola]|uniref:Heme exporter protein D n=1 Tax=Alteromonas aquimaris TaxID=2998417 RepID=A0ABT3P2H2_9ALTE|nr:heme exporter protein CcmD [Alteromonas aquimaris]MCW8106959.1 heme exporter protein CcmD [Alteromonas aquimaris]